MAYPQRPQTPNALQLIGQGVQQVGQTVGDFQNNQEKMRMLFADMVEKKRIALAAQRKDEDERAAKEAADKTEADFLKGWAPLASEIGATSPDELADLEIPDAAPLSTEDLTTQMSQEYPTGTPSTPAVDIKAGGDSTALMGAALKREKPKNDPVYQNYEKMYRYLIKHPNSKNAEKLLAAIAPRMKEMADEKAAALKVKDDAAPTTTDIKEFEYAQKQGFKKSFTDWMKLKTAGAEARMGLTERGQTFQMIQSLAKRMEDDPSIKSIQRREIFEETAKTAYEAYQAASSENKDEARRQTDHQLLFSLAKIRDEGVVMPGEFDRETKGQGWLKEKINEVKSGVTGGLKLDDNQRAYILGLMKEFKQNAIDIARPRYAYFRKQGEKYGDADFVTGTFDNYFQDDNGVIVTKFEEDKTDPVPPTPPRGTFKPLDEATFHKFMTEAGGDVAAAKKAAAKAGYNVND